MRLSPEVEWLLPGEEDVAFYQEHGCRMIHGSDVNRGHRPRTSIALHLQDGKNCYRTFLNERGEPWHTFLPNRAHEVGIRYRGSPAPQAIVFGGLDVRARYVPPGQRYGKRGIVYRCQLQ